MYGCAWFGDKWHLRGPFVIFNAAYGILGLGMLGFLTSPGARYAGAFLATSSCNANIPCILTWQANNIRGQWKRARGAGIPMPTSGSAAELGVDRVRTAIAIADGSRAPHGSPPAELVRDKGISDPGFGRSHRPAPSR